MAITATDTAEVAAMQLALEIVQQNRGGAILANSNLVDMMKEYHFVYSVLKMEPSYGSDSDSGSKESQRIDRLAAELGVSTPGGDR